MGWKTLHHGIEREAHGLAENAMRPEKCNPRSEKADPSFEVSLGRESRQGVFPDEDPMLAWLPRQAADLFNRYKKGSDGRTPEVRPSGKHWRKPAIAFGERLYFREVGEGTRVLKEGASWMHRILDADSIEALDSDECQMPTDGILLYGIT